MASANKHPFAVQAAFYYGAFSQEHSDIVKALENGDFIPQAQENIRVICEGITRQCARPETVNRAASTRRDCERLIEAQGMLEALNDAALK